MEGTGQVALLHHDPMTTPIYGNFVVVDDIAAAVIPDMFIYWDQVMPVVTMTIE